MNIIGVWLYAYIFKVKAMYNQMPYKNRAKEYKPKNFYI